jgi:hypothetical protein
MRQRTCDHYTSSTLFGGKGEAGPNSLHTTLEGLTEYVNVRWMESLHGFLHGIKWIMFHGHLDYFRKPTLGGRPNTKPGDHGTPSTHNRWLFYFIMCEDPAWIEIHWTIICLRDRSHTTSHYTWGSVTPLHDFGGSLGRWPLNTFFRALIISWSQLLARVWSRPNKWPCCGMAKPWIWNLAHSWLPISVQDWSLQYPSNVIWPFKLHLSQNNPSKCNPILKTKMSLEVLNIICMLEEPTSVGHRHYKKWSKMVES